MIYTVTLNPALDRAVYVDNLKFDDLSRVKEEAIYAGGKGIDVSRAIKELGGQSVALGIIGGFTGLELQGRLINEGITCDFVTIAEETRTNIIIKDCSTKKQMLLSAQGPELRPHDVASIYNKISRLCPAPSFAVMGGSLPRGVTPNIYAQFIKVVTNQGGKAVLDADNEPLRLGLEAKPYIIKPNIYELGRLAGREIKGLKDVFHIARELNKSGIEIVVVSLGAKGLVVVSKELAIHCTPPKVRVVSTVGAGDSSVAGLVLSLEQGKPLREAVIFATAAGTAATLSPGTELCHKEDVERLLLKIKARELR
ncbi:MAG TPA: 1-phosphofructokinase [Candidatus Hypogeohydataceae bacterium YC41]